MLRNLALQTASSRGILGTPRVGVLASEMPSGFDSPGLLNNDVLAGDPAGTLYRVEILTAPSAGVLEIDEYGAFSFTGAPDGSYTVSERVTAYSPVSGLLRSDVTTLNLKIGVDAAQLQASLQASATVTAVLAATPKQLQAVLSTSSTIVASLSSVSVPAQLQAALVSASTLTASLTKIAAQLSASLISSASVTSALATYNPILLSASIYSVSSVYGVLTSKQGVPMFTPSTARTVAVQSSSPLFVAGKFWNLTDPKKPRGVKDPNATIDITFDWDDWLTDVGSPLISEITFTIGGADSQGSYLNDSKATVFVSGGTVGTIVTVACKIKTATTPARIDERTVYLSIEDQ